MNERDSVENRDEQLHKGALLKATSEVASTEPADRTNAGKYTEKKIDATELIVFDPTAVPFHVYVLQRCREDKLEVDVAMPFYWPTYAEYEKSKADNYKDSDVHFSSWLKAHPSFVMDEKRESMQGGFKDGKVHVLDILTPHTELVELGGSINKFVKGSHQGVCTRCKEVKTVLYVPWEPFCNPCHNERNEESLDEEKQEWIKKVQDVKHTAALYGWDLDDVPTFSDEHIATINHLRDEFKKKKNVDAKAATSNSPKRKRSTSASDQEVISLDKEEKEEKTPKKPMLTKGVAVPIDKRDAGLNTSSDAAAAAPSE